MPPHMVGADGLRLFGLYVLIPKLLIFCGVFFTKAFLLGPVLFKLGFRLPTAPFVGI